MNERMARVSAVLILLTLTMAMAALPRQASANGEDEVRAAVDRFYVALNEMFDGKLEAMDTVWSHAADVTYMGPGGDYRVGWEQVRASWEEQASMKLGGQVKPEEVRIVAGPELAVVHNYERGANVGEQGRTERVSIRATSVFRKEQGSWKMIGHHTDRLTFIEQ